MFLPGVRFFLGEGAEEGVEGEVVGEAEGVDGFATEVDEATAEEGESET